MLPAVLLCIATSALAESTAIAVRNRGDFDRLLATTYGVDLETKSAYVATKTAVLKYNGADAFRNGMSLVLPSYRELLVSNGLPRVLLADLDELVSSLEDLKNADGLAERSALRLELLRRIHTRITSASERLRNGPFRAELKWVLLHLDQGRRKLDQQIAWESQPAHARPYMGVLRTRRSVVSAIGNCVAWRLAASADTAK